MEVPQTPWVVLRQSGALIGKLGLQGASAIRLPAPLQGGRVVSRTRDLHRVGAHYANFVTPAM